MLRAKTNGDNNPDLTCINSIHTLTMDAVQTVNFGRRGRAMTSTDAIGNDHNDRDEWEELPVLLQSDDVSDLIRVAQRRGLSASTLAGSVLREFLRQSENYACGRRLPGSQP